MSDPLQALLQALDLAPAGADRFTGRSVEAARRRIFGGELVAQALMAAARTAEGRLCHSLHCSFLAPGDPALPLDWRVRRLRDGRRFAQRQVQGFQGTREIFLATAAFAAEGPAAPGHQLARMPRVPPPEGLPSDAALRQAQASRMQPEDRAWLLAPRAVDLRTVDAPPLFDPPATPPVAYTWLRAVAAMPDDPLLHQAVLAFASDMTLLDIAFQPHARSWLDPAVEEASLDHALWFHRPFRADEWLLFAQTCPVQAAGRAFAQGSVFTRGGELVVTAAQEGLARVPA